nr:stage III sporulation protein AG [uncultured Oscillibacter sp.]
MVGTMKLGGVRKLWDKYKFAALVALIGAGLLLWPSGSGGTSGSAEAPRAEAAEIRDIQGEMEEILGTISGVGQVKVMLTEDSDGERQLAQDTELAYSGDTRAPEDYSRRSETVLVGNGSGGGTVVVRTVYPTYRGALVVCQGGDRAEVRLAVTEAVAALTGLSADRITVAKWQ